MVNWTGLERTGMCWVTMMLEFKLMGLEMAVHLPGHFAGLFPGHIYLAERPTLYSFLDSRSLKFLLCHVIVSLHR